MFSMLSLLFYHANTDWLALKVIFLFAFGGIWLLNKTSGINRIITKYAEGGHEINYKDIEMKDFFRGSDTIEQHVSQNPSTHAGTTLQNPDRSSMDESKRGVPVQATLQCRSWSSLSEIRFASELISPPV